MDIVGHRKIFYAISGVLVGAGLAAIAVFGIRLGIDFTGGSFIEVEFRDERPPVGELASRLERLGLGEIRMQPSGERGLLIRARHLSEEEHRAFVAALGPAESGIAERRFDTVGPTIGRELRRRSAIAIALVLFLIVSYIAWAFRKVSAPVQSWKYGMATVVALIHDIVIPAGFFALAGRVAGFEADTLFVTALLTILGFSVHDTIVVFDRVRENLQKAKGGDDFGVIVNRSVSETFVRSVNTSLTVVIALAAVWLFGGASTQAFALTLVIGIVAGTYSSIFIASPLLVTWHEFQRRKKI
ncbi:MAG: protein-export membrane protein SecF [Candidatus Sungbacteria bacterium RIFCSPLOWO2_01_FULL_59_16]|uniref:Protein-export membrane protein SecF n=1 Tax=Candidatus Sungbacteria bacterium RIFCSPLOWO2_01_FULL_59_16 TaxID=1802280 RepID=A0A1G2LA34_9BACT|nr:MAG: protein-export membrane protein SecF [Candidatus Sungbacteria bacterium RIFCSPLOWO2_01_FULL_59_16]